MASRTGAGAWGAWVWELSLSGRTYCFAWACMHAHESLRPSQVAIECANETTTEGRVGFVAEDVVETVNTTNGL